MQRTNSMKKSIFILILVICIYTPNVFSQAGAGLSVQQSGMSISFFSQNEACNNGSGNISATVNSGTPPYSYIWSNGGTTSYISNLHAGTYTVIVTDNNGMTASNYETIYNAPLIHGYGIQNNDIFQKCVGIIDLNGISNGVSPYSWDFGDVIISNQYQAQICATWGQQIATNDGINPTTFHRDVIVTDANGCSGIKPIDLKTEGFAKPDIKVYDACNSQPNGTIYGFINLQDSSRMYNGFPFLYDFSGYTGGSITGLIDIYLYDSINPNPIASRGITPSSALSYYYHFDNLSPGNYHLQYKIDDWPNSVYYNSNPQLNTPENFPITIHNLGTNCGNINGNVFVDYNKDCIKNQADGNLQNSIIKIEPGENFTVTDSSGNYSVNLLFGNYLINHNSGILGLQNNCPGIFPFSFNLSGPNPIQTINFADTSNGIADLLLNISSSTIIPSFQSVSYISVKNNSLNFLVDDTITLVFDSTLLYNSTSVAPFSITSNTITWIKDSISPLNNFAINTVFSIPSSVQIGDQFKFIASASTSSTESDLTNNSDSVVVSARGPFDPNYITVDPPGYSSDHLIPITQNDFDYQINFQNTGNDTAHNVILLDTISGDFDLISFTPLLSSSTYSLSIDSGRVLKFRFNNINLPDSSTNFFGSEGFVKYRITKNASLAEGTIIHNSAAIIFDFNAPVITNDAFVTLYDCENILQNLVIQPLLCEGNTATFNANATYPSTYEWYFNNVFQNNDSAFTTPPLNAGNASVILIASTPYCNDTLSYGLNISANPTPSIIVNGDTLNCDDLSATTFQWYLNGLAIVGANQISYVAIQGGAYTVSATEFNGCSGTSADVTISLTGIEEINNKNLSIQPNPFKDYFTIFNDNAESIRAIQIYSSDGKMVYSKDHFEILPSGKFVIDMCKNEKGIYLLKEFTRTSIHILKMIKQ